ncbi:hypothetical protein HA050_08950 [Iodobacter sp. HSC-16F04]|uniref:Lipoprotein n=1 Tax=Iodobacter violaceini TaxID=3044271 RepID=A0ABX0KUX5_9NEIS|nr:hypothetical protein [Iodobacter violacea]NHQ86242.1 hypothetical protein [Iodobacter violacea]
MKDAIPLCIPISIFLGCMALGACTTTGPVSAPPVTASAVACKPEIASAPASAMPADKLQALAQQLMSNHADLNRIQTQLDAIQITDPVSQSFAQLMASQLAERKRLSSLLDKQTAATKEQQKRANDLAAKLDALKEMEKDMLERNKKP